MPLLCLEYLPLAIAIEVTFPTVGKWCFISASLVSFDKLLMYNFVFTYDPRKWRRPISIKLLACTRETAEENQNQMDRWSGQGRPPWL